MLLLNSNLETCRAAVPLRPKKVMSPLSTIDLTMLRAATFGERSIAPVRCVKSIEDRPYLQILRATPLTIRSGASLAAAELRAVVSAGSGETRCSEMGSTASGSAKELEDAPNCIVAVSTGTDWTGAAASGTAGVDAARALNLGSTTFLIENIANRSARS